MELQIILNLIIVTLLILVVVLILTDKKKYGTEAIEDLIKKRSEDLRDSVIKQISMGATEQFERFGMIQQSIQSTLQGNREEMNKQFYEFQIQIDSKLSAFQQGVQSTLQGNREEVNKQLNEFQIKIDSRLSAIQQSSTDSNERISMSVNKTLQESRTETNEQLSKFSTQLDTRLSFIQTQMQETLQSSRIETNKQLREFQEQLDNRLLSIQRGNTENIEKINSTLENKMKSLQDSNEKRLEQMQAVVDEKLQKTLESRLAQSFELVSKQLDNVQNGLGEMKNLAADAKSLKNALTNVKERGTYGEVRLEKLLSDILAPTQYEMNVEISNNKRVEFAIKLPGNGEAPILLPIDSKFPIEDFNRLLDADGKVAIEDARKSLAQKIRVFAKDIFEKYIVPPKTTDFALMFLPTEGLYAEVVQNVALFEELRDKYKVTAVGVTTLSAFLSSLQMGFKTLAIEQRSQEVWDTLRAVKSEFTKFGDILDRAHKQIQTADKTLEEIVGKRTRAINKTLRTVEELSEPDKLNLLESASMDDEEL